MDDKGKGGPGPGCSGDGRGGPEGLQPTSTPSPAPPLAASTSSQQSDPANRGVHAPPSVAAYSQQMAYSPPQAMGYFVRPTQAYPSSMMEQPYFYPQGFPPYLSGKARPHNTSTRGYPTNPSMQGYPTSPPNLGRHIPTAVFPPDQQPRMEMAAPPSLFHQPMGQPSMMPMHPMGPGYYYCYPQPFMSYAEGDADNPQNHPGLGQRVLSVPDVNQNLAAWAVPEERDRGQLLRSLSQEDCRVVENMDTGQACAPDLLCLSSPQHASVDRSHRQGSAAGLRRAAQPSGHPAVATSTGRYLDQQGPDEGPPRTVQVTGSPNPQPELVYRYYFQNPEVGGGPVKEISVDSDAGLVHVTFAHAEDAVRVTGRPHKIADEPVRVSLYVPPKPKPTYPDKLLFGNLPDTVEEKHLKTFLKLVTASTPTDLRYGDEDRILVTFDYRQDVRQVQRMCRKEAFDDHLLTVSLVDKPRAILVSGLDPSTDQDSLQQHFETVDNGGGRVEKVDMMPEHNKCIVYFDGYQDVDRVLSVSRHTLGDNILSVTGYFECLGPLGGRNDLDDFPVPKSVQLQDLNSSKMQFLHQRPVFQEEFEKVLTKLYAQPTIADDSITVVCLLTTAVPRARHLARTWPQDVQQAVTDCLGAVEVQEVPVQQQNWSAVEARLTGQSRDLAVIIPRSDTHVLTVVGRKEAVAELVEAVKTMEREVEEETERKKQEVREKHELKPHQLRLLTAVSFDAKHPDVCVELLTEDQTPVIVLQGNGQLVNKALIEMYKLLQKVESKTVTTISSPRKVLLQKQRTERFIVQKLKDKSIAAVWETSDSEDTVLYAFSEKDVSQAHHIIEESVVEDSVGLCKESVDLVKSVKWETFEKRLTDKNKGVLIITPELPCDRVRITGTDDIVPEVREDVVTFIQNNTLFTQIACFLPNRQKFIVTFWSAHLEQIGGQLKSKKVTISTRNSNSELVLQGTSEGLDKARTKLLLLGEKIHVHAETFTDLAMVKYFSHPDCPNSLELIGASNKCVLALYSESSELHIQSSDGATVQTSTGPQPGQQTAMVTADTETGAPVKALSSDAKEIKIEVDTRNPGVRQAVVPLKSAASSSPTDISVSIVEGEIATQAADVMVNTTTPGLDLETGAVSSAILAKAGQGLQDDCKTKHPNGVKVGEVAVTKGHGLRVKEVYHLTLPTWSSPDSRRNLSQVVTKCLTEASSRGYTSIVFPALGTGKLNYPRDETARTMLQTISSFKWANPSTSLRDVRIAVYQKDTQTLRVFRDMQANNQTAAGPSPPQASLATGPSLVRVSVMEGEIALQKADVMVNSTNPSLNLKDGAVTSAILAKAGQGLQDECNSKHPNGVKIGDIAVTGGHGLDVKAVYHLTLASPMFSGDWKQNLSQVVTKCLTEASNKGYTSIVFPALGTGKLNYPRDETARTMLETADGFQRSYPLTSLRDVRIVVYQKDTQTVQVFREVLSQHYKGTSAQSYDGFPSRAASSPAAGIINVSLVTGEIAQQKADVVVNTTTPGMTLKDGAVSSSILAQAGQALQDECKKKHPGGVKVGNIAVTQGHELKVKDVYHLTLPVWSSADSNLNLSQVVTKCLTEASNKGYTSIVFPALGTGKLNYPRDETARTMLETIDAFQRSNPSTSLRDVRIVVYQKDTQTVQVFSEVVEQHNQASGSNQASLNAGTRPMTGPIQASVVEGEIALQKADVMVNTTTPSMDLKSGAVSSSILAQAGNALQGECKTKHPDGVKVGEIAITGGHGLQVKQLYHTTLRDWSSTDSKKNLSQVVTKCLTEASNKGYTSIVFPALGTGKLNYPRDETARTMLETIDTFQRSNPSTSLRDVRIVVYQKDTQTCQEFRRVLNQFGQLRPGKGRSRKISEAAQTASLPSYTSTKAAEYRIAGLTFALFEGDILEEDTDVVVSTHTNQTKDHVDCKETLATESTSSFTLSVMTSASELQQQGVAMTPAFGLKCEHLVHLNMARFGKDVDRAITRSLEAARSCGAASVAMPYITAGKSEKEVAEAYLKAIREHQEGRLAVIRELRVFFAGRLAKIQLRDFAGALRTQAGKMKKDWFGFKRVLVASSSGPQTQPPLEVIKPLSMGVWQPSPSSSADVPSAHLFIYTESKDCVPQVVKALKEYVEKQFPRFVLDEKDALMQMNEDEIQSLYDAGRDHNVDVRVNPAEGKVELHGYHQDLLYVQDHIKKTISQAEHRHHEDMIAKMVQWSFLEVTSTGYSPIEYGKRQNRKIEQAFLNKDKVAKITDEDGNVYIVDFDSMTEYPEEEQGEAVYVVRREKTGLDSTEGEIPKTWLPHLPGQNLKIVNLKASDKEYRDVEANFMATLNKDLSSLPTSNIKSIEATVVTIDRIQNELLMKHYLAKKVHMDKQNPSSTQNERTLWHGTASNSSQSINQEGFNRSYCGKNATVYGQGVYFAVNSSYSAQPTYSAEADKTGYCYVYQCKVLTGCTTKGDHKMRFLPKRVDQVSYDSATDNVTKPAMYVIFNDTQAYPEYLITFKKKVSFCGQK